MSSAITKSALRALKPRDRMYEITCSRLPGFVVRVLPSGKKVFLVRLTVGGRSRRVRIGAWGPGLSLAVAREQALQLIANKGAPTRDRERGARATPLPERHTLARREPLPASAYERSKPTPQPTVRALSERFIKEYVDVYLRPGTAAGYRLCLKNHILPVLGDRPFDTVSRRDARALHASLSDRRGTADTALNVLGSLYTRIIDDWELSDMRNPTAKIRRFGSRRVERFLSPEERRRLETVLEDGLRIPPGKSGHLERFSVWAIRLLMLTGLRRNEILSLTWPMVNWQHSALFLPETKTGQRTVVVSREVLALLREIHEATRIPNGLVIRGRNGNKLKSLNSTWETVRVNAGIPDVRLHDLRHSFASDALMSGVPLAVVGELLGHRQPSTTKRYAHLSNSVVREALETTTRRIVSASSATPTQTRSFVPLTDCQWRAIAPIVEATRKPGGRSVDLRATVDGIRWVLERKAKWRELPAEYGTPTTTWRWYKRWRERGVWAQIEDAIR